MERIALFDFDGTLIPGDSIVHLIRFAARQKRIGPLRVLPGVFFGLLYKLHLADESSSKNAALSFLRKMKAEEQSLLMQRFVQDRLIPHIYPEGLNRIRELQKNGTRVWLVSASTDHYMPMIAEYIGADLLLCTQTDQNGRVIHNCKGQEKVRRVRQALSSMPGAVITEAYADSKTDLPMFKMAEKAIAVNPKQELKKEAPYMETLFWE